MLEGFHKAPVIPLLPGEIALTGHGRYIHTVAFHVIQRAVYGFWNLAHIVAVHEQLSSFQFFIKIFQEYHIGFTHNAFKSVSPHNRYIAQANAERVWQNKRDMRIFFHQINFSSLRS